MAKTRWPVQACHSIHDGPEGWSGERQRASTNSARGATWRSGRNSSGHQAPRCRKAACLRGLPQPAWQFLPKVMQTVAANEPGCFKCHGDKRGPFTFEHAPVKIRRLLELPRAPRFGQSAHADRRRSAIVCLECHANLPGPADRERRGIRRLAAYRRRFTTCAVRASGTAPSATRKSTDRT